MKQFITFSKPKKFVLITEMLILAPFSYTINYSEEIESSQDSTSTTTFILGSGSDLLLSSSTLITIPKPEKKVPFSPIEKVKKGFVDSIYSSSSLFLKVGDNVVYVESDPATSFYFGDEKTANFNDLEPMTKLYVFGRMKSDNSMMLASKIVIANKKTLPWKRNP